MKPGLESVVALVALAAASGRAVRPRNGCTFAAAAAGHIAPWQRGGRDAWRRKKQSQGDLHVSEWVKTYHFAK